MKLWQATWAIGERVKYQPHPNATPEYGTITGISTHGYVFVLYDGDCNAKATHPRDLEK